MGSFSTVGGVTRHRDLIDKEIGGVIDHADGSITTSKLADASVTTPKLADLSVTTAKIADASITTAKLADASVTTAKLADGSVTTPKIAALSKIDLIRLTADPTLAVGRIWLRDTAPYIRFSPDGITVRSMDVDYHKSLTPIDHPDRSVTRAKLEYPTVDVSLAYLAAINKATALTANNVHGLFLGTSDDFTDKAFEAVLLVGGSGGTDTYSKVCVGGRVSGHKTLNSYLAGIATAAATADFGVVKFVNGTATVLGTEAVDIGVGTDYLLKISILGTTINAYRADMVTPKVSVTDTSLTAGKFGASATTSWDSEPPTGQILLGMLRAPSSTPQTPVRYFEVPVIGSGTPEDPFRPQIPEENVWEWSLNPVLKKKYDILKLKGFTDDEIFDLFPEMSSVKVNRLALTQSSLVKTDSATGKPTEYRAIVRVYDTPRQPYQRDILSRITVLKGTLGVRELTRDEAIREAKRLDDKLTDVDLMPIPRTDPGFRTKHRDYVAHRIALGVKSELIDEELMERYAEEEKGW